MKLQIISVGKMRNKHYRALSGEYLSRLEHYRPVEEVVVRESRALSEDISRAMEEEALAIEKVIAPGAISIAMDERGDLFSSEQLAAMLEESMIRGTRHVAFCIGNANGLQPEFRARCSMRMALAKMTLPHEMAKMMLVEQLYRAMTILRGEPYHK